MSRGRGRKSRKKHVEQVYEKIEAVKYLIINKTYLASWSWGQNVVLVGSQGVMIGASLRRRGGHQWTVRGHRYIDDTSWKCTELCSCRPSRRGVDLLCRRSGPGLLEVDDGPLEVVGATHAASKQVLAGCCGKL